MALDQTYLEYPHRHHGMDHQRYNWRNMFAQRSQSTIDDLKVAFMITVPVEFFPLNPADTPFKAPGSMVTPYPDFRHYTTRDYGNRVGVYRLLKLFYKYHIKANFAVNSEVADRYPKLLEDILLDGHEIIAHGVSTDSLHYGGMDPDLEESYVRESLTKLRDLSSQPVRGWLSPAFSESFNTPDLVAKYGCSFIGDWVNDDLPYTMHTKNGDITALPISQELSDRQIIINYRQTENSFVQQVKDQLDCLYEESNEFGARLLSLTLTPYISGLPYRISSVEQIISYIISKFGVYNLTGSEVIEKIHCEN